MSGIRMLATGIAAMLLLATGGPPRAGEAQGGKPDPAAEKACLEFARKVEETINAGDPSFLDKSFDRGAMLAIALEGLDVSPQTMSGINAGLKDFKLGSLVVTQSIRGGGSYKFLRLRTVDGQPRALFRLLETAAGGLNYHELILAPQPGGAPRVPDFYVYLSAERMSETMRRALLPAVADGNKGLLAKLTGQQSDFVRNLPKIQAIQAQSKQGKYAEALATLKALPASLQADKNVLVTRVAIAANVGEEEHLAALEAMRAALPGDPCLDVMSMDVLFIRKKYAEALAAVDRVDKLVGGDPYLHVGRGAVYHAQKQLDKARVSVQKALDAEPRMVQAHFTMIAVCLAQEDYAAIVKTLGILENDLGMELNDLTQVPDYADFVKSEEFKKWQAGRPKPAEEPAPAPAP